MKQNLYAILDTLAEQIIGGVLLFPHDAAAIRFFGDILAQPGNAVQQHPGDHTLLRLASIDGASCAIEPLDAPRPVLTGEQWLAVQQTKAPRAD